MDIRVKLALITALITSISSCNSNQQSSPLSSTDDSTSTIEQTSSEKENDNNENFDFDNKKQVDLKEYKALEQYTPTTFDEKTYKEESEELGDGVLLVKASYDLNTTSGKHVTPYYVLVDLNKANIVAGSYKNTHSISEFAKKSTPVSQANSYEKDNPTKKVMAVTNADFFGSTCVNAFVKDGYVLKQAHNYDLNDVPVSYPMLFGIYGNHAKIAPMTYQKDYKTNLKGSFIDNKAGMLYLYKKSGEAITIPDSLKTLSNRSNAYSGLYFGTNIEIDYKVKKGNKVFSIKKIQKDKCKKGEVRGYIEKVSTSTKDGELHKIENEDYAIMTLGVNDTSLINLNEGDYVNFLTNEVVSSDGRWSGYTTVLGARHSLVENGIIPDTVAKETSNGANYRVPRTAVGVRSDGKVVIVSVEDLHYNKLASTCTGLNLTQLADFMRYIGCYDAANFDGGGSSQLSVKNNNGLGDYVVKTISSDTGIATIEKTRLVLNSIMVTTK
ncbi:MAG: phosphodiester glycosidase family protein [Candidatus Caccosoma sp.]|nr:phosphodiester glycosidase family protein [Candidatus Caccosoma sp.]